MPKTDCFIKSVLRYNWMFQRNLDIFGFQSNINFRSYIASSLMPVTTTHSSFSSVCSTVFIKLWTDIIPLEYPGLDMLGNLNQSKQNANRSKFPGAGSSHQKNPGKIYLFKFNEVNYVVLVFLLLTLNIIILHLFLMFLLLTLNK